MWLAELMHTRTLCPSDAKSSFAIRSGFLNLSCEKQTDIGSFDNLVSHHTFKVELKKREISTLY